MKILQRLKHLWLSIRHLGLYVVADSCDNSISFSRRLFRHIQRNAKNQEAAKVYAFSVPSLGCYAFTINPEFDRETQLAEIQYNDRYRSIGFASLCPSVNRIFLDYGIPFGLKVKLSVQPRRLPDGKIYYAILPPSK